jgi:hypothetical protein
MFFHNGFIHNMIQKIYEYITLSSTYVVSIKKVGLLNFIIFYVESYYYLIGYCIYLLLFVSLFFLIAIFFFCFTITFGLFYGS